MPTYDFSCIVCDTDNEKNVTIEERDNQFCGKCGNRLNRNLTFKGSVYAPTAGGMK